ncbi:MAG: hypothetical protein KBG28_22485 [Kofleriaceae bacterium]|nr:hypothetical protein [Kofleriaceae bacterium]
MTTASKRGWFRSPPAWAVALATTLVAAAAWLLSRGAWVTAACALLGAAAWPALAALRPANRHRVAGLAVLGITLTLAVTWATAGVITGVYYLLVPGRGAAIWLPVLLPAALNVGGLLALFRSIQTRTETSAALRELSALRTSVLSAPLVESSVRALEAEDLEAVLGRLQQMLQLAVGLSLLPRAIDRGSVWVRDDSGWTILASTHSAGGQSLRQPALGAPRPGAGLVACLAAHVAAGGADRHSAVELCRGDVLLVAADLDEHPWFMANPTESRHSQGIAMVLLRHQGEVSGAVCVTCGSDAIPTAGPEADEMVDILTAWAHAFATAIGRFFEVAHVASADPSEPPQRP